MRKWLAGIAGAIIAGLVLWWVTAWLAGGAGSQSSPESDFKFTVSPNAARRGGEVLLHLSEAKSVVVYYNGRTLPKKVSRNGKVLTVTIPGDAKSGFFELTWNGHSVRAPQEFIVLD
ncbi:MAG: hypothetical protein ACYTEQ_30880 [Planctomycetota bacterium]|jgi:hypothetical protein